MKVKLKEISESQFNQGVWGLNNINHKLSDYDWPNDYESLWLDGKILKYIQIDIVTVPNRMYIKKFYMVKL